MTRKPLTGRAAREEGVISKREVTARIEHKCSDCRRTIHVAEHYTRRYGSCHPGACTNYVINTCEACEARYAACAALP